MSEFKEDGSYYVEGRTVRRHPKKVAKADGTQAYSLGFPVCTLTDYVSDDAAKFIAQALNAYPAA